MFGGLTSIVAIVSAVVDDDDVMPSWLKRIGRFDISHTPGPRRDERPSASPPDERAAPATAQ